MNKIKIEFNLTLRLKQSIINFAAYAVSKNK